VRYAILFSGMTFKRHLNGLEFCYRTLVDRFGFDPGRIFVLSYDNSLRTVDEGDRSGTCWPGDGTPYRMTVTDEGSRRAFQSALAVLREKLTPDDQLFINTTGHGGNHDDGRGPYLIAYPHWDRYMMSDFCADLATLPPHRSLLVLMAQCYSGGFNNAVLDASRAQATCIAAAAGERDCSHAVPDDGNWDSFERDWIVALARRHTDGSTLVSDPDKTRDEPVGAREAFDYANHPRIRNPRDSPSFAASSDAAQEMTLEPCHSEHRPRDSRSRSA
jgi:hypothetical protein